MSWEAPMLDGGTQVETPVGEPCLHCGESIVDGDQGVLRIVVVEDSASELPIHVECDAIGVVGHMYGVCSCHGYDTSSRRAARELWRRMAYPRRYLREPS